MINMIVAMSKNGAIGKNGTLPWRIPEDLKTFKELTMGGVLFVGKNTARTLPPLKGREVIVLNRNSFPTLADIKTDVWGDKEKWIIGGAAIYAAALETNIIDRAYITFINKEYDGDTFFSYNQLIQFAKPYWEIENEKVLRVDPLVTLSVWRKVV